jgi:hypothetical protein
VTVLRECYAFDFDGVLHAEPRGGITWSEIDLTLIADCHARGIAVAIMTCNDTYRVAAVVRQRGFQVVDDNVTDFGWPRGSPPWNGYADGKTVLVTNRKVLASRYIDDKAHRHLFEWGPERFWVDVEREPR